MLIGARNKNAIVSLVKRKKGFTILVKGNRKTSSLISRANIWSLKTVRSFVKTITDNNIKKFLDPRVLIRLYVQYANALSFLQIGNKAQMKTSTGCFAKIFHKKGTLSSVIGTEFALIEDRFNNRSRNRR